MADITKKIIFKYPDGTIGIVTPSNKTKKTTEEVAKKSVPTGLKYKIVDKTEIDTINVDRTFRNAWEIDEAELTDGVGD
jgi:hypothetical protein|tara:strand:- start:286 stop:522 length:237 start_codon:yes stop_codon:yes gene_type:complete